MNEAQEALFDNMHTRNVVLKARQLGMTTFMMILMLDAAIFRPNTQCAIICHNREDAARLFDEKVKFAYDNLPASLKSMCPTSTDRAGELKFSNGSRLSVGTSFRGGTLRYLHVSEFGKICAKYPDKAREIVTGAFEAVGKHCVITLESTAEGRSGYFFDYCQTAEQMKLAGADLSVLDWKFFFYDWSEDPAYTLDVGEDLTEATISYFEEIEVKTGRTFTEGQKRWYQAKKKTLGDDMKREYPTTPQEAFEQSIVGAYYSQQFLTLYRNKQITKVPHESAASVHTIWDIGVNDQNAIWFVQQVGREWHVIDYYENSGEGLDHYIRKLQEYRDERNYTYGTHIGPHDLMVREWGNDGKTRLETALSKGIRFEVAPRMSVVEGIEAVRNFLPQLWFDESRCSLGLARLQNYRKQWDDKANIWRDKPLHDDNSNGADAFRYFAVSTSLLQDKYSGRVTVATQAPVSYLAWS